MNSKEIAIHYIGQKIKNPKDIFENEELFQDIMFWSRESAKELLNTKNNKRFLVNYIDDVGSIVDEYMTIRRLKMYHNRFEKKNKYCLDQNSSEKIISFIISRWLNVFYNLTSNPKYKDFIDISCIRIPFDETITYHTLNKNDKDKELDKRLIKKALKKIWEENYISDNNFSFDDFNYLCKKYNFKISEVLDYIASNPLKGECLLIVAGASENDREENLTSDVMPVEAVEVLIASGMKPNQAIKTVAKERKINRQELYNLFHGV